jgi:hypothetical protein
MGATKLVPSYPEDPEYLPPSVIETEQQPEPEEEETSVEIPEID